MLKENYCLSLECIRPNPNNYRIHTEAQLKNIQASLLRFGQGRSIVCQEQDNGIYLLVAGHGVYEAARRLRYTELRADILPSSWSFEMTNGYILADNKLSETGQDDPEKLLLLLREQAKTGIDLASLGASSQEMQRLLEEMAFDDERVEIIPSETPKKIIEHYLEPKPPLEISHPVTHYVIPEDMPTKETIAITETGKPTILVEQRGEKTPEESLFRYNTTTIRQIVLIYSQEEYSQVMTVLAHIREVEHLDTNTDAITFLLNQYAEEQLLEKIALENE